MKFLTIYKDNLKSLRHTKLPRVYFRLAALLCVFLLSFIVFIAVVPWQQTASGEGTIIAYSPNERQQHISAPIAGRLGKWFVQDGSFVNAGDPIVDIQDVDPEINHRLQIEQNAIKLRLSAAENAVTLAENNVKRHSNLYAEGISSQRMLEQAKFELAKHISEVATIKIELVKVQSRIAKQANQLIKAPISGVIMHRMAGSQSVIVKTGDTIAQLLPNTKSPVVELYIDGNDLPLVELAKSVRLQFEGWPAIQFSGWPSVAVGTFPGTVILIDAAASANGKFRILVGPTATNEWPETKYLKQGTRVHGWVMLGQVPLWFELWRRFNGFPPSRDDKV